MFISHKKFINWQQKNKNITTNRKKQVIVFYKINSKTTTRNKNNKSKKIKKSNSRKDKTHLTNELIIMTNGKN